MADKPNCITRTGLDLTLFNSNHVLDEFLSATPKSTHLSSTLDKSMESCYHTRSMDNRFYNEVMENDDLEYTFAT